MTTTAENENLFQLTGVGVVQIDMKTGRFMRANRTFCAMVGYSEAELQGITNAELTHPEDWERDRERFAALQKGELHEDTAITRVLHKDGHEVWLELSITIVGKGEQATNITIITDITERKQAEQQQTFFLELSDTLRPLADPKEVENENHPSPRRGARFQPGVLRHHRS